MTNTKTYRLSEGDIEITLEVDLSKFTPELAKMVNEFFSGANDRLARADGDVIAAALLMVFPVLFRSFANGYNEHGAISELHDTEGFPSDSGITISDYVMPDFSYAEVYEVE